MQMTIKSKKMRTTIFIALLGLISACQSKESSSETQKKENTIPSVEVSAKQMQTMGISLGKLEKKKVDEFVLANGMIEAPPESKAIVTAKMEGFVKKCDLLIGDFVRQGQVLTILEAPRLLTLQEEYLNTKNQLIFLEQEVQRQRSRSEEKSTKNDQRATKCQNSFGKFGKAVAVYWCCYQQFTNKQYECFFCRSFAD
jgi:cobalt-zinc-cadmium efflux system membrane fusion protein